MDADPQKPRKSKPRMPACSAEGVGKKVSLNLSLDRETVKRIKGFALLSGLTPSALVERWAEDQIKGLVFHLRNPQPGPKLLEMAGTELKDAV